MTTAPVPGAVALLQLHGSGVVETLSKLTGKRDWPAGRVRLVSFSDIDEGLAVVLRTEDADDKAWAQVMPHGGPRVVQRMVEHMVGELGCVFDAVPDAISLYPEARSTIEADMLQAIAHAASPAAVDLLASQPGLWRTFAQLSVDEQASQRGEIASRSRVLNRLLDPPTVVVAGPANVGKSTLTNRLMGKAVSLVADLPGTTRDWVGAVVELDCSSAGSDVPPSGQGEKSLERSAIAVRWLDTPGLRDSDDPVEQRAIQLASSVIRQADVLVAMRDAEQGWPPADKLPRTPDLWVINKIDDAASHVGLRAGQPEGIGKSPDTPLAISAMQGAGLDALQRLVLGQLGLMDLVPDTLWAFSEKLQHAIDDGLGEAMHSYVGV